MDMAAILLLRNERWVFIPQYYNKYKAHNKNKVSFTVVILGVVLKGVVETYWRIDSGISRTPFSGLFQS